VEFGKQAALHAVIGVKILMPFRGTQNNIQVLGQETIDINANAVV
jgi:hypothetical protein